MYNIVTTSLFICSLLLRTFLKTLETDDRNILDRERDRIWSLVSQPIYIQIVSGVMFIPEA